jgi:hypothetical protein
MEEERLVKRRGELIMIQNGPLSAIFALLFLVVAFFYLFRLARLHTWMHHVDAEDEVGHGVMAIGMACMLAPAGLLTPDIIHWNIVLFALTSLWWTVRLFVRKPLLALLLPTSGGHSSLRADAIHVLMHIGMCYMFLLISNMALSMTRLASYVNCTFFIAFAFLTFFYGKEISRDLQAARLDWLKCGANIAHALMSGVMCWMFLVIISMIINMGTL